jgi:hypothetical protein
MGYILMFFLHFAFLNRIDLIDYLHCREDEAPPSLTGIPLLAVFLVWGW